MNAIFIWVVTALEAVLFAVVVSLVARWVLNLWRKMRERWRISSGASDPAKVNSELPSDRSEKAPFIDIRINWKSLGRFLPWLFLAVAVLAGISVLVGDEVRVSLPSEEQHVGRIFVVRGEARGAPQGTFVFVVVRNLEVPGSSYQICDSWTVGPNGWWQGVCEVPGDVPALGKVLVYAVTTTGPDYIPGERYSLPVRSNRRGGQSNAVTVRFSEQ